MCFKKGTIVTLLVNVNVPDHKHLPRLFQPQSPAGLFIAGLERLEGEPLEVSLGCPKSPPLANLGEPSVDHATVSLFQTETVCAEQDE